jgi:hypothetical protein
MNLEYALCVCVSSGATQCTKFKHTWLLGTVVAPDSSVPARVSPGADSEAPKAFDACSM